FLFSEYRSAPKLTRPQHLRVWPHPAPNLRKVFQRRSQRLSIPRLPYIVLLRFYSTAFFNYLVGDAPYSFSIPGPEVYHKRSERVRRQWRRVGRVTPCAPLCPAVCRHRRDAPYLVRIAHHPIIPSLAIHPSAFSCILGVPE